MGENVETCIVVRRVDGDSSISCDMKEGRDLWWDEEVLKASSDCPCEEMDAEDPLFILYITGRLVNRGSSSYYGWLYGLHCNHA